MNNDLEKIWQNVQGLLSSQMKGPSFQTWIKPTKLVELEGVRAVIAVKNDFNKNFLKGCYFEKITQAIESIVKRKINLDIVVRHDLTLAEFVPSIANLQERTKKEEVIKPKSNLNPSYTFESFVVGASNQFCHAAALAVAETQSREYNPLFIYGGVGLGKTHLVNAVANYCLEKNKDTIVSYSSSETFTNELIHSIRTDSMNKFREKYRHVDLLMLDDIQFLAGKEATQEEFFHTFNTLKENGKQIILTSDRPPSFLASMTDRLKNRFEGGLIADIQIPDLETRIAILTLKAIQLGINLSSDVAEYIATVFPNNIRELEGALKRVNAYLAFCQEELSLKNVQKVLQTGNSTSCKLSPEAVLQTVASFYNISYENLISLRRSSDLTLPRHVSIFLLHDLYSLSFPRIGELLSNRTHSSAIYSYQKIKKRIEQDATLSEQVSSLKGILERRR